MNNNYPVQIYTDSSKASSEAHRLAVIAFKTPEAKKADASYSKPAARCVSVPKMLIAVEPVALASALQAAFEDLQDAVIRKHIVTELAKDPQGKTCIYDFSDSMLSPEAVAAYAAEKAVSGKLSKEALTSWFTSDLEPQLCVALAKVLNLPDEPDVTQQATLEAALKEHGKMIVSLASPKAAPSITTAKQLRSAVKLAADSKTKRTLLEKLDAYCQPVVTALSIGLGSEE